MTPGNRRRRATSSASSRSTSSGGPFQRSTESTTVGDTMRVTLASRDARFHHPTLRPRPGVAYETFMTASDTVGSLLERLSAFLRYGDRSEEEVQGWLEEIDEHAQPSDLPRLFAILDDDDTSGVLWDVLYIAESMDDDYLRALLDQLPAL